MGLLEARQKAARKRERQQQAEAKPKGALGALKTKRIETPAKPKGALGALKKKKVGPALAGLAKARAMSSKLDFISGGIRYHNARIYGETAQGRPWGTVDVTNGDKTYTFHNKHSSWFYDIPGQAGYKKEPSSFEIATNLQRRFDIELKSRGILTLSEKRAKWEEEEKEKRKRLAKLEADREKRKAKKEEK